MIAKWCIDMKKLNIKNGMEITGLIVQVNMEPLKREYGRNGIMRRWVCSCVKCEGAKQYTESGLISRLRRSCMYCASCAMRIARSQQQGKKEKVEIEVEPHKPETSVFDGWVV